MITDRCTTACLLVFLATAKPAYSAIFQGLISLDFASHYMHMYATLVMGGQTESHKNVSADRSWIMNLYYTNKVCTVADTKPRRAKLTDAHQWVLFTACALNELFFIALYLLCFSSPIITPALLPANGTPGIIEPTSLYPGSPASPKPSLLFPNPFSAAAMEMARANKMDSTVPWALTLASAPVMLFKQYVNCVQLYQASQWLAEGDRRDRKAAGLNKKR